LPDRLLVGFAFDSNATHLGAAAPDPRIFLIGLTLSDAVTIGTGVARLALPFLIRSFAIAALIPIFVLTWSRAEAFTSGEARTRQARNSMEQLPDRAQVEIDVFSGRPNPTWELGRTDLTALLRLLKKVSRVSAAGAANGLGFRGFKVSFTTRGTQRELHVKGNSVTDEPQHFSDDHKTIERFLLAKMPPELHDQLDDVLPH